MNQDFIETGRCLLHCMILGSEPFNNAIERGFSEKYFSYPEHNAIFRGISSLRKKGSPEQKIDIVTLKKEIKKIVSWNEYNSLHIEFELTEVYDSVVTKENHKKYFNNGIDGVVIIHVAEEYFEMLKREVEYMVKAIKEGHLLELQSHITDTRTKIAELEQISQGNYEKLEPILNEGFCLWEETIEEGRELVTTQFSDIDKRLGGGFHRGELIVIGARPGTGKTALIQNFILNQIKEGKRVLSFNMEMGQQALIARLTCQVERITFSEVNKKENQPIRLKAFEKLKGLNLFMNNQPGITPNMIRAELDKMPALPDIIYVDYLQIMGSDIGSDSLYQKISQISIDLKTIASDFNIPIVVLSQLNRSAEGKNPGLSNLKESGQIEQDADIVVLLSVDESAVELKKSGLPHLINFEIAKHRNGETGYVKLMFTAKYFEFKEHHPDMAIPEPEPQLEPVSTKAPKKKAWPRRYAGRSL